MELNPNLLLQHACVPSLSSIDEAIKKAQMVVKGVQVVDEGSRLVLVLDAYHKAHVRSIAKQTVASWEARLVASWAPISLDVVDDVDEGWIFRVASSFSVQRGCEATAFFTGNALLLDGRNISVFGLDACGVTIVSFTGKITPMLYLYFPMIWHENGAEINGLLTAVFLHNNRWILNGSISASFVVTENKCLAHTLWLLTVCEQMLAGKFEEELWHSRYLKLLSRFAEETKNPGVVQEFAGASFPFTDVQRRKLCDYARLSATESVRFLDLWNAQGTIEGLSHTEDSVLPRSFYIEFGVRCNEMQWQKLDERIDIPQHSFRSLMSVADGQIGFDAMRGQALAEKMLEFHRSCVLGKEDKWWEIRKIAGAFAQAKNAHLRKYFKSN